MGKASLHPDRQCCKSFVRVHAILPSTIVMCTMANTQIICVVSCKVITFSAKDFLGQTLYFSAAYTHKDTDLFLMSDGALMHFVYKHYMQFRK